MPKENLPPEPPLEEHASVRFETSDANFRWILSIVIGAAITGVIIHFAIMFFFKESRNALAKTRRSPFPLAMKPSLALPTEPRLEQLDRMSGNIPGNVDPRQNAKTALLHHYGPTKEKDFIHIPIDRAMQLLADKLPTRQLEHSKVGLMAVRTFGFLGGIWFQGPIAAVVLLAERSKTTGANNLERSNGLVDGGASNSGRMFKTRGQP